MKNKIEFKKTMLLSCIVIIVVSAIFQFYLLYQYKVYTGNFNKKIGMIVTNVQNQYPNIDKNELIQILNNQEDVETGLLKQYGINLENDSIIIQNGIKQKFNENSQLIDRIDWNDSNGYVLYAMLKKEFNFLEPFSTAMGSMNFNNSETRVKCFGVDSSNNPVASKNVEVLFYNSENDFAIKLKTKEGEEVILYKTTGENKSFEENYEEIKKKQGSYSGKKTFGKEDMLRVPFIKVNDEINYDELCGREIKNSKYYIKQALQTIDFELNNVGGSVKSEVVIDATTKALTENARKMIFDSDFILYLKEENKEQPYFALKVDNTDVLVPDNVYE